MRRLPLACLTLLSPLLLGCPEREEDTLTGTASGSSTSDTDTAPTSGDSSSSSTTVEPSTETTPSTESDSGTIGMSGSESGGTSDTSTTEADTEDPVDDCEFLVDRTFLSLEELECGLGPNGVELCNWQISFTADGYMHDYSDISEVGSYTCSDGKISGLAAGQKRNGTVNAATGTLIWEDVQYSPQ